MSSDGRTDRIPTNEEVVDELTKDLKSSAIRSDDREPSVAGSCDGDGDDREQPRRLSESDPETAQDDEPAEIRDADYVDDLLLKERDENATEEEKRVSVLPGGGKERGAIRAGSLVPDVFFFSRSTGRSFLAR